MSETSVGAHLVIDPAVCHGQLTFRDTRIPVDAVLTFLARGHSVDHLLQSWPELSRAAIEEAATLAEAMKRYDEGEVSIGRAIEMAGIPRDEFVPLARAAGIQPQWSDEATRAELA